MSMTQFAMVEELAFLVKDNLPSKHLVLSVEEALVSFIQDDTSSDGVLELEPMNAYNRLLLHRLSEIFGFSHTSVGEGDDRHLVLERCSDTSIPSILVSDILWQYEEPQSPIMSHQLLRRTEALPALKTNIPSYQHSLEERRADYFAARNRIFSVDSGDVNEPVKRKPRNVPMVARRMIAHALGHRINPNSQVATMRDCKKHFGQTDALEASQQTIFSSHQNMNFYGRVKSNDKNSSGLSLSKSNTPQKLNDKISPHVSISKNGSSGNGIDKDYLKKEHLGAAKRMFANALGLQSGKDGCISKGNNVKYANME
ncbi:hypothetical protein ACJW31_08G004000 [Castanea mollissima]